MTVRRRDVLLSTVAVAVGGAVGVGGDLLVRRWMTRGFDADVRAFRDVSREIRMAHARQTAETVARLKQRFEAPVFGKVRVWEMIEKLAQCVDVSDPTLLGASQFVHVKQVLAGMERDGVSDPDLHLVALLHDLGKVLLLTGELPEHVVGTTGNLGEPRAGSGLDNAVFQFGHPEFIYSRMKDHVSDHVAWLLRYHGVPLDTIAALGDRRDKRYADSYLKTFRRYDIGTKSSTRMPSVDMTRYRALIEQRFPAPILI